MSERFDPEGRRLPIKLDATSNGEFLPRPVAAGVRYANRLAQENATGTARKLGLDRRAFLKIHLRRGRDPHVDERGVCALWQDRRNFYALPREAPFEPAAASERSAGRNSSSTSNAIM